MTKEDQTRLRDVYARYGASRTNIALAYTFATFTIPHYTLRAMWECALDKPAEYDGLKIKMPRRTYIAFLELLSRLQNAYEMAEKDPKNKLDNFKSVAEASKIDAEVLAKTFRDIRDMDGNVAEFRLCVLTGDKKNPVFIDVDTATRQLMPAPVKPKRLEW